MWTSDLLPALRGMARAQFATVRVLGERDGTLAIGVSKEATRDKCAKHLAEVEQAIADTLGERVKVTLVVTGDVDVDPSGGMARPAPRTDPPAAARAPQASGRSAADDARGSDTAGAASSDASHDTNDADDIDDIGDIAELDDVPPDQVATPENLLKEFFPGSSIVEER